MIVPLLVFAQISGVQFVSTVSPKTVYLGQQVSYDAAMRVNALAASSFQVAPEYTPPDVMRMTAYDFPFNEKSVHPVSVHGLTYQEYAYHRALFPLAPGTYTIPPAMLKYALPDENDPYKSNESTLHTEPQTFTVLPLPEAGKPTDFVGAVGHFTIAAKAEAKSASVGASFVLTVTVTGDGNIDYLPRPTVNIPWATVVKSTEESRWDSTGVLVRGSKTFRWAVNPNGGGAQTIAPITYSYFDPDKKQYVTASTTPISVTIAGEGAKPTAAAGADTASASGGADASASPFAAFSNVLETNPALVFGGLGVLVAGAALIAFFVIRSRRNEEDEWE